MRQIFRSIINVMCCEATRIRHLGYTIDLGGTHANSITIYDPYNTLTREVSDRIADYMIMEAFVESSVVRVNVANYRP